MTIDLPDRKDRLEILAVHARKKPFGPDVKFEVIAERTPGFSGAELYSLMNEAAILAARENRKEITQYDSSAPSRRSCSARSARATYSASGRRKVTAYHEGGHALVSSVLPYADPVHKYPSSAAAAQAGTRLNCRSTTSGSHTKKGFLDDIAATLGRVRSRGDDIRGRIDGAF